MSLLNAKWKDEEDIGDVKDNWDDDDEEPVKKAPVKSATQELREKRLRDEKLQRESEIRLTKQMLGMEDKDISLEFPLNTKEDFDKFHKNLVHKLWCYDKDPNYFILIEKIVRDLCAPLESDELKNLSTTLNAMFNEKVKSKAKPKKKSAKGLAVKVERNNLDCNDYADDLDDIM